MDKIVTPDGRQTSREIVEHPPCVAVVAVAANGDILLVRQYREAAAESLLEIPAGGINKDESPEAAVARELREEIGLKPGKITPLGGFYSTPGYGTEYLHLFLATELEPAPLEAEDTAAITVQTVSPEAIAGLIRSGEIKDAKTIAGLLRYLCLEAV